MQHRQHQYASCNPALLQLSGIKRPGSALCWPGWAVWWAPYTAVDLPQEGQVLGCGSRTAIQHEERQRMLAINQAVFR